MTDTWRVFWESNNDARKAIDVLVAGDSTIEDVDRSARSCHAARRVAGR